MALQKYKTGLNLSPAPPRLRFASYFMAPQAPPVAPPVFGHYGLIDPKGWGMLRNDALGDCSIAGPMHISMLWNKIAGRAVHFTGLDAMDDYAAACGWDGTDATDQGGDIVQVAQYWQKTGFRDSTATRHTIAAFLALDHTNSDHIYAASYLFDGGCGIGVELPSSAEAQFDAGEPWSVVEDDTSEGGHFIPLVGRDAQFAYFVSWGRLQRATPQWVKKYTVEAVAYLSPELLTESQTTLESFNYAQLQADLATFR